MKLMLIGVGGLGGVLLELLARERFLTEIVAAGRNSRKGQALVNQARLSAAALGCRSRLRFLELDLNRVEATARLLEREAPDLVLSTATMQTWWLPSLLPPPRAARLKAARFGAWLPVHLNLTLKLMKALKSVRYPGIVLTAPFPDVVNCVLGRIGLAPTAGVGNLAEIVPKVRLLAAQRLQARLEDVRVHLVAHHALEASVFADTKTDRTQRPPFFLHIGLGHRDVTEEVEGEDLLFSAYPTPGGPSGNFLTAAATIELIRALSSSRASLVHVPGPSGLPGGYPCRVGARRIRPTRIPGLSLAQAVSINERCHPFDGIESIDEDGSVTFTAESREIFREELNYDCARLTPEECEPRARELMRRFREYALAWGVSLPEE